MIKWFFPIIFLSLLAGGCVSATEDPKQSPQKLAKPSFGEANPLAPKELQQFGRFAGRWQCSLKERRSDGTWRPRPSQVEWTWFYTLSGYAVQDIWTPQSTSSGDSVIATNLRMFNAQTGVWNVAWSNTQQASFELWSGSVMDDEIVMTSVRDRRPVKIRFFNISPRQFQWSYEAATSSQSTQYTVVLQMQCYLND